MLDNLVFISFPSFPPSNDVHSSREEQGSLFLLFLETKFGWDFFSEAFKNF
jgi:hypothetical protein